MCLTTLDTKDSVDTISYHFKIFNSNDYQYTSMTVLSGPTNWMSIRPKRKIFFHFYHVRHIAQTFPINSLF